MTQPAPDSRHTVDSLTDPDLTRLYDRLDYLAGYAATLETYATEQRESAERAEAALNAVRALHQQQPDAGYCDMCSNHGDITWPCATIRALDAHTNPKDQT